MGILTGLCYLGTGWSARRWSHSLRFGAPASVIAQQDQSLKLHKLLSFIGAFFSILLFSFSVYLTYMMGFWYNYDFRYLNVVPVEAFIATPLHVIHAVLAFVGFLLCVIHGCLAKPGVPHQQPIHTVTYQVQVPPQNAYTAGQPGFAAPPLYPQPPYPVNGLQQPVHYAGNHVVFQNT